MSSLSKSPFPNLLTKKNANDLSPPVKEEYDTSKHITPDKYTVGYIALHNDDTIDPPSEMKEIRNAGMQVQNDEMLTIPNIVDSLQKHHVVQFSSHGKKFCNCRSRKPVVLCDRESVLFKLNLEDLKQFRTLWEYYSGQSEYEIDKIEITGNGKKIHVIAKAPNSYLKNIGKICKDIQTCFDKSHKNIQFEIHGELDMKVLEKEVRQLYEKNLIKTEFLVLLLCNSELLAKCFENYVPDVLSIHEFSKISELNTKEIVKLLYKNLAEKKNQKENLSLLQCVIYSIQSLCEHFYVHREEYSYFGCFEHWPYNCEDCLHGKKCCGKKVPINCEKHVIYIHRMAGQIIRSILNNSDSNKLRNNVKNAIDSMEEMYDQEGNLITKISFCDANYKQEAKKTFAAYKRKLNDALDDHVRINDVKTYIENSSNHHDFLIVDFEENYSSDITCNDRRYHLLLHERIKQTLFGKSICRY